MTAPGFLPLRQLVLVDLLGLLLAVRPGERAVVAIDGPEGSGRAELAAELGALARRLGGREMHIVPLSAYRDAPYRYDVDTLRREVLWPFCEGLAPVGMGPPGAALAQDAMLVLEGDFLRRPELRGEWAATALVSQPDPGRDAEYVEAQRIYRLQSRTWAPEWIVDNTDLQRPELVWPDPDEPQWFEQ